MTKPFLYDLFDELRTDGRFNQPGLPVYFDLIGLIRDGKMPIGRFDDIVFLFETLFLKDQSSKAHLLEILGKRKADLIALGGLLKSTPVLPPMQPEETRTDLAPALAESARPGANVSDAPANDADGKKVTNTSTVETVQVSPASDEDTFGQVSVGFGSASPGAGAFAVNKKQSRPVILTEQPFLFTDDYFPVKNRQMRQAWRTLRLPGYLSFSAEIDLPKTVERTAKAGYFSGLVFKAFHVNRLNIFILIDSGASMAAVEAFGNDLYKTAEETGIYPNLFAYYFAGRPQKTSGKDDYQVTDHAGVGRFSLGGLFAGINRKEIVVLIYSDSGILRPQYDERLLPDSRDFLKWLYKRTNFLSWINPAPKERWTDTVAGHLFLDVPMFDSSRSGVEQAIAALRGKITTKMKNPYVTA